MNWSLGYALAAPFYLPRVIRGKYRASFSARMGRNLARIEAPVVWLHACSVGEAEAAAPLVEIIRRARPEHRLVISTVTETGNARARKLFPFAEIRYLPFDFLFTVRRALDAVPRLSGFFIMETEIWPNLIEELHRRRVPIFISNGRISDRAWTRYRRFAGLFRPVVAKITAIAARTESDAERFRLLGGLCVAAVGDIKFDRPAPPPPRNPPNGRFVIFGSTHPGEEEICARVFQKLKRDFPELRAIIAPRHIERASSLAGGEDIIILDTHGELASLYAIADVAFVGGSLVPVGGHNPLEPAACGVPVLWGPHVANFRHACDALKGHGGYEVRDEQELYQAMRNILENRPTADFTEVIERNRGAAERNAKLFGLC